MENPFLYEVVVTMQPEFTRDYQVTDNWFLETSLALMAANDINFYYLPELAGLLIVNSGVLIEPPLKIAFN